MAAKPVFDLTLYLVVGGDAVGGRPLDEVVAAAVRGGVTLVQLREKTRPDAQIVERARALKNLLGPLDVPLIVNDRVEVARAAGADGVHLGQDDLDAARARAILGPDRLIGVSAGTAAEAAHVDKASADYVGIGPVYATPTKLDAGAPIGVVGLSALAAALAPLPAVAIGGIGSGNAAEVMASGAADGIAVVSAICGAEDPEAAARALRREIAAGREGVANRT
ncbi:MAG: thiamine phosphate synthase [Proteobacteria bacterium]|nr:thiamine phosphate synthase [Pseudomonadota bacterium]